MEKPQVLKKEGVGPQLKMKQRGLGAGGWRGIK